VYLHVDYDKKKKEKKKEKKTNCGGKWYCILFYAFIKDIQLFSTTAVVMHRQQLNIFY